MSSKLRQRCLLLFVFAIVGLSISFCSNLSQIPAVLAKGAPPQTILTTTSAKELEAQGKYFYSLSQFKQALDLWQQAAQIYQKSKDYSSQARLLSNIALAHSQLNNWTEGDAEINASLELLNQNSNTTSKEYISSLAQIYNNQGILQLNQGRTEEAIATWSQAKVNYAESGNELGVIRASINQANAFKQLGFYRRALKTLTEVEKRLIQQPDSVIKATGLRSYGDILRLVGQQKKSREVLEQSQKLTQLLKASLEEIKSLIALGNSYKSANPKQAFKLYQQASNICSQELNCSHTDLPLQINLAQLNLSISSKSWYQASKLIPMLQAEFDNLPNSRSTIDRKINFAHNLVKLKHSSTFKRRQTEKIPDLATIEQYLTNTLEQAKFLEYKRAQSYILGLQGQIKEESQDWKNARNYTQKALLLGQNLNAPEVIYLWQWQLGRINQALGDRPKAIAHYSRAVELLKSLSQDLAAIVFREACLDAQEVDIERIDRQAAVIYPIILQDRLEVIVSLPNQPLKHYITNIAQDKLEKTIAQFRHNIVVRSRRNFYPPAQKLYQILIAPVLQDLTESQIKTLVFVPDGAFRNIPLGALYDGQKFLIEDYSIALTPGLQLLNPKPLEQVQLTTIAAGLTKRRQGFSALDHVNTELKQIGNKINSVTLLNKNFTAEALQDEIKYSNHPIVHIATHGQFSSSLEDTFLLAWDERININELDSILQTRNPNQDQAIELLVLSACETASGDKWAALGLAGIAVRAGARSTLATLWSVNDRATSEMMSDFYHELVDKKLPKAEAVRQAQLSLIHDSNSWHKHPFYWAPYVLLGNWL